jgi:hypothetical protein
MVNSGTINLTSSNSYSNPAFSLSSSNAVLTGHGTVNLLAPTAGLTGTITNIDNLISGTGTLSFSANALLDNRATITASTPGAPLTFNLYNPYPGDYNVATIRNTGTLSATNGATLVLSGGVLDNTNGNIVAYNNSIVSPQYGTVVGGTLSTVGNGIIQALGGGLKDVTNLGRFDATDSLSIAGAMVNSGTINLTSSNSYSNPAFALSSSNAVLLGNGTVTFSASSSQVTGKLTNTSNTIVLSGSVNMQDFENSGLVQLNGNALTLSGSLVQTGGATILSNSASLTTGSAGFVLSSGTLAGTGTIHGNIIADAAVLAPRSLQIIGDLSLTASSAFQFAIGGRAAGTEYSLLSENGSVALNLNGTISIQFENGFDQQVNSSDLFTVLTSNNDLSGSFTNAPNGSRIATADGHYTFVVNYGATSPYGTNDLVLSDVAVVPEPSTWILTVGGLGAALAAVRARRRRQ